MKTNAIVYSPVLNEFYVIRKVPIGIDAKDGCVMLGNVYLFIGWL